jgi:uncharacterized protein
MYATAIRCLLPLLGALAFVLGPAAQAQTLVPIPKFEARVTDLTGTLTAEQQAALEQKLAAFEGRKGSQLALLMVASTKPEEIEQYSIRVVDAWKPGRKGVDDGALLVVAKDDRRLRIEVGRGLEGALTDITSNRIIEETITPLFRQGDFYGGINAGLDQMIRVIDGEPLPAPEQHWSRAPSLFNYLPFLFGAVFIGSVMLRAIFGRVFGSVLTGGGTGLIIWALSRALGVSLFAGFIALLMSFFLAAVNGSRWSSGMRGPGWGGGFGGGGFGGGGFGGGGGGGFSGGGASGSW